MTTTVPAKLDRAIRPRVPGRIARSIVGLARHPLVRVLIGAGMLALVVAKVGAGPFLSGLRAVTAGSVALAVGLGALTTLAAAWRWRLVASRLALDVPLRQGVAAYYRSQFLNTVLPGGILGDLHRGARSGAESGAVGRGLRAVAWERAAGQAVQVVVAAMALLLLPSPVRPWLPVALGVLVIAIGLAALGLRVRSRLTAAVRGDLRGVRPAAAGIVAASLVVVAGHVATYLVALRVAGAGAPAGVLIPLALLALLAMSVPTNVGGWGPREGVAAWSFAAAGLGAGLGVAAATAYGVLVFAACLPGAAVLVGDRLAERGSRG